MRKSVVNKVKNNLGFTLVELLVSISIVFSIPVHLVLSDPNLVGATRLERLDESVLVYKNPGVTQIDMYGSQTPIDNWVYSDAWDFVVSDWLGGPNPASFSRNGLLSQASDLDQNILNVCTGFDLLRHTGEFGLRVTTMEVVHSPNINENVLLWHTQQGANQGRMLVANETVSQCSFDTKLHSTEDGITNVTGEETADLTAIAEDRLQNNKFLAFDSVSGSLLRGSLAPLTSYSILISPATFENVVGGPVDLKGNLVTDPSGNIYAWDNQSDSLLYYHRDSESLSIIKAFHYFQKKAGGQPINIVDIDYIEGGEGSILPQDAVVLLDNANGSILLYFPYSS